MGRKYGIGSFFMDAIGVCAAPFTYGASLVISPSAHSLVGDVIGGGSGSGNDSSNIDNKLKEWEIQNDQWKKQVETQNAELERLRKEREEENKKLKKNNKEIEKLRTIINDPNKSDEEKSKAKKRLVIIEGENRKIKDYLRNLEDKIKKGEENPIKPPSKPWSLYMPNFSGYDKLIIGGVTFLIIYYLFLKEDKK